MKCKKCKIDEINVVRSKIWCNKCLDNKKKHCHEYYENHKDKFLDKNRKRQKDKPKEIREYARSWAKKNRKKCNEYRKRRRIAYKMAEENSKIRSKKLNILETSFSKEEWKFILGFFGNRCLSCGTNKKLEPDHVIPLVKGGSNSINNIQPLCRSCNSKKGTKIIDYRPIIISITYLK